MLLFVNPRRACAARVTVVGFVCLSVTLHLTYRVSVRPRNDTIYPTGDEGQKIKAVFSIAEEVANIVPFYPCGKCACAYIFDRLYRVKAQEDEGCVRLSHAIYYCS